MESAERTTSLDDVTVARQRTIIVLGHEHNGIPDEVLDLHDDVIEVPMIGRGASLNVAVVGSLVGYQLSGLA